MLWLRPPGVADRGVYPGQIQLYLDSPDPAGLHTPPHLLLHMHIWLAHSAGLFKPALHYARGTECSFRLENITGISLESNKRKLSTVRVINSVGDFPLLLKWV